MKVSFSKITLYIILFSFSFYSPCSSQEQILIHEQSSPQLNPHPRVSIITSVFDPDDLFMEHFLYDITRQSIFDQCELILIQPPNSGHAQNLIQEYLKKYSNIRYITLDRDPGLYAVWNLGVQLAQADFLTNANIDDRRNPYCLEMHAKALEQYPDIALVYSDFYVSRIANTTFEKPQGAILNVVREFTQKTMYAYLAGPMPMWRKSIHNLCGYFRSDLSSSADWEFWCRMVSKGFNCKKISGISGIYYLNPKGASTDPENKKALERLEANKKIIQMYPSAWL